MTGKKKDIGEVLFKVFALPPDLIEEKYKEYSEGLAKNPIQHVDREWGLFDGLKNLTDQQIDQLAIDTMANMSIEEKVNQMCGDELPAEWALKLAYAKRGVNSFYAGEDVKHQLPALKFTDGPTGVTMKQSTAFPVAIARGATWDVVLEEEVGNAIGIEARAQDANLFTGVCINVIRHPAWGRSQESFGEDTCHLGKMGTALVTGVQNHIMACAKHFAGNSIENCRFKVSVDMEERTLREIYLPHFKKCVAAGVASVMSAYNRFRGEWCGHHAYLLTEILKQEWGFKGFVVSDFLFGIRDTKEASLAGMDLEMPSPFHFGEDLVTLVKNGTVPEKVIDAAAMRIIRQKIRFAQIGEAGLYTQGEVVCKEHIELAKKVALKSSVLLKNTGILPLTRSKLKRIAVIGTLANQANLGDTNGSSGVVPPYVVTPLEGLQHKLGDSVEILYADGIDLEKAKLAATGADAVIAVVGLTCADEGERFEDRLTGGDRESLGLHQQDIDLIEALSKANQNVIVCVEGGGAITMEPWKDKVSAILMVWYPGMEGGNAIADLLFGEANPCGKLPVTIPGLNSELPYFNKDAEQMDYGYFHGYYLADKNSDADFPFGFGLSYTTYKYENLRVHKRNDTIEVSVDVANIGKLAGEEIVQVYVGYVDSSVLRHQKDLKNFGKLQLEPGENKTITLDVPEEELAYYDPVKQEWVLEDIEYIVYVGSSSRKEDLLVSNLRL